MKTDSSEQPNVKCAHRKSKSPKNSEKKKQHINASAVETHKCLQHKNSCDYRKTIAQMIAEQNKEIASLKEQLVTLNENRNSKKCNSVRPNSPRAQNEVNCFNNLNEQLQTQLDALKVHVGTLDLTKTDQPSLLSSSSIDTKSISKSFNVSAIKDIQNKLNLLNQKFFESRNKNVELQNQLKLAQKCLQQEIGENINLNTLASQSQGNWCGRAKEIVYLQQKLQKLKKRLKNCEQHSSKPMTDSKKQQTAFDQGTITDDSVQSHRKTDKKSSSEKVTKRLSGGGTSNKISNSTIHISKGEKKEKSPRKNLSDGYTESRDGSQNDTNGIFNNRNSSDNLATKVNKLRARHQAQLNSLQTEIASLRGKLDEKTNRMILLKKHNELLKEELDRTKGCDVGLSRRSGVSNPSHVAIQKKYAYYTSQQFEMELLKMQRQLNEVKRQRDEEAKSKTKTDCQLQKIESELNTKENIIQQLRMTVKNLEADLKAISGGFLFSCRELRKEEFIGVLNSLESEKKDLIEYNKALNCRIKKERQENKTLLRQLNGQKISAIHLEMKICEMAKELSLLNEDKCKSNSARNKSSRRNADAHRLREHLLETRINQLIEELSMSRQAIATMENKIQMLNVEKDNDAHTFEKIIENSKNVLLETIFNHRASRSNTIANHNLPNSSSGFD